MAERNLFDRRWFLKGGASATAGLLLPHPSLLKPERLHHTEVTFDSGMEKHPYCGYSSWYDVATEVNEDSIRRAAYGLVETGLAAAGFKYVNIDDRWSKERVNGVLAPDQDKFQSGIKTLAEELHELSLRLGLYTDIGSETFEGGPGSYEFERIDMQTFASWGVDFVKVDKNNPEELNHFERYTEFSIAVLLAGRPMHFNICNWGDENAPTWGRYRANSWRTSKDIDTFKYNRLNVWDSVMDNYEANQKWDEEARPGNSNDPDNLMIGRDKLTPEQEKSHVLLWVIMSSPLVLGCDPKRLSVEILDLLKNPFIHAIHKDPRGVQGKRVIHHHGNEVLLKPLENGKYAMLVFNRTDLPVRTRVRWSDVGNVNAAIVQDVLHPEDISRFTNAYTTQLPPFGASITIVDLAA